MRKYLLFGIFLLAAFFAGTAPSFAEELDPNKDYLSDMVDICPSFSEFTNSTGSTQGEDLKFISTLVHCFEDVINDLAITTMAKMNSNLKDFVNVMMLLYVIIFGAMISMGMVNNTKSEIVIHALKITFVSWVVNQAGLSELWQMTLGSYQSMLSIMIAQAQVEACPAQFISLDYIWDTMDCLFSKIIGYNAENGYGDSWQGVVLIASTLVAKATEGGAGAIPAAMIANALLTVLFSFLQIAMAYIISMIGLTLLFSIAPLMLPMMFFKATNGYFEAWYRMILSFILQVTILFAFLSFAFAIMSEVYSGENGLQEMYKNLKLSNEVSRTDTLGTNTMYLQKNTANFTDAMNGKGDMSMVINFISMLVLGYLMLSFISVVGKIAHEISGTSAFPNMMDSSGGGMNFAIPKM